MGKKLGYRHHSQSESSSDGVLLSRQTLMILLCVALTGLWLGCEIRRDSRHVSGASREAVKKEPIVRVRIAKAVDRVIIDAPCHPKAIPNFISRLLERLDYTPELIVEPKADLNYVPCSAASVPPEPDEARPAPR